MGTNLSGPFYQNVNGHVFPDKAPADNPMAISAMGLALVAPPDRNREESKQRSIGSMVLRYHIQFASNGEVLPLKAHQGVGIFKRADEYITMKAATYS